MLWQMTTSDECMVAHWQEKTTRLESIADRRDQRCSPAPSRSIAKIATDRRYYERRAAEERTAAARSRDLRVQRVHFEWLSDIRSSQAEVLSANRVSCAWSHVRASTDPTWWCLIVARQHLAGCACGVSVLCAGNELRQQSELWGAADRGVNHANQRA